LVADGTVRKNTRIQDWAGEFRVSRCLEIGSNSRIGIPTLLCNPELHYNPEVPNLLGILARRIVAVVGLCLATGLCLAQQAPPAAGARILLLPRKLVTGERATLAVLDVSGKLTPAVRIEFSNGDKLITDATGRANFVAPLTPGVIYGAIEGRAGRVYSTILTPAEVPSSSLEIISAQRVASLSDRMDILGHGFCGDADANRVSIGVGAGLVLAASPAYLAVLPPLDMEPGPARVQVQCGQKTSVGFTVVFVSLELEAKSSSLAPGEHRSLLVRVRGSTAKTNLEAHNLAPDVAELKGGATVRAISSGGTDNTASFELQGKQRGNFVISIRLLAPQSAPRL
jgi:hypothetical protein